MVSSTEKPGPVGFRSPGLRECRSAVIIRVDAVFFQVPPEGGLADAEFGRHLLAVAVMLFQQSGDLDGLLILIEDDLFGPGQRPWGDLLQLLAEEHFVDVPLLGQQHEPLADAVELVQIAGPLILLQIALGPLGQVDIALVLLLPLVQIEGGPAQDISPVAAQGQHFEAEDAEGIVQSTEESFRTV